MLAKSVHDVGWKLLFHPLVQGRRRRASAAESGPARHVADLHACTCEGSRPQGSRGSTARLPGLLIVCWSRSCQCSSNSCPSPVRAFRRQRRGGRGGCLKGMIDDVKRVTRKANQAASVYLSNVSPDKRRPVARLLQ